MEAQRYERVASINTFGELCDAHAIPVLVAEVRSATGVKRAAIKVLGYATLPFYWWASPAPLARTPCKACDAACCPHLVLF